MGAAEQLHAPRRRPRDALAGPNELLLDKAPVGRAWGSGFASVS